MRKYRQSSHLVYFFTDPSGEELLYVGRTCNLNERLRLFVKKHGFVPGVRDVVYYPTLDQASVAELEAIQRFAPPLNKKLVSSPGCLGKRYTLSAETRKRMSRAAAGKPKSASHLASFRKPKSAEHRLKLAESLKKARAAQRSYREN